MSSGKIEQDWTPVVFRKPTKPNANQPQVIHTVAKARFDEEGQEIVSVKKVTREMAQLIVTTRNEKKWTQKELGVKCNLEPKVINEVERGGCNYNADQINRIAKALGITIPRPK